VSASVDRCVAAARAAGIDVDMREFPDGTRTAADAAAALGCEVDQIVKSMVFDADGEIVLALTSGGRQVDGTKLAALAGVERCDRADPLRVREVTGYAIGGVTPYGHLEPVRTWIDPHLLDFPAVWAAGGSPRHVFPIPTERLVSSTGGVVADFTRR
jgi:prolyl-tRNA editing enzyme YbaK/EbsC (Cys-tRNA(Pro) deacylase)